MEKPAIVAFVCAASGAAIAGFGSLLFLQFFLW
jgi:hypothetical protein